MKIAINTPNGNIGRPLVNQLLDAGQDLILLTRSPEKTKPFADRGATIQQGNLEDEGFVVRSTEGIDALFWVSPGDYSVSDLPQYLERCAQICTKAVTENRIPHVMTLSSAGAQLEGGTGPILGLGNLERMLDKTDAKVMHVRPNYFMENFLQSLESIAKDGKIYFPFPGSVTLDFIATRDIAKVCGDRLLGENWAKRTIVELAGPEAVSHDAAAALIGQAIGKEVKHVEISGADFKGAVANYGFSQSAAEVFLEMYDAFTKGIIQHETPPQRMSTTFRWFAENVITPAVTG